jgi:hypothetical protein
MHPKALAIALFMALMMLGIALVEDSSLAFAQVGEPPPPPTLFSIIEPAIQQLFVVFLGS